MKYKKIGFISKTLTDTFANIFSCKNIFYISEPSSWVIERIGIALTKYIITLRISITHYGILERIIHIGSFNMIFSANKIRKIHKSNKTILTCFHLVDNDKRNVLIQEIDKAIDLWHTSCSITKNKLIEYGINSNKVIVIPLGIDLFRYKPLVESNTEFLRKNISISSDSIVIGSFQKDGIGWGNGDKPKLIKGPDIFCQVAEKLNKHYRVFVLLSGPSRGYVINFLNQKGIPFFHQNFENSYELYDFYRICHFYLITSRVEGGPLSLLEAMASGTPVLSTRVGMAADIIQDGINGFLTEIDDTEGIYRKAVQIIENPMSINIITQNASKMVQQYNWNVIAQRYQTELYQHFL